MALYDLIKDCISVAQKADNVPLVQNLIDAQKQLLDLMHENDELKKENDLLKEHKRLLDRVERHKDAYISLKDDPLNLVYCSCCFDRDGKLVQGQINEEDGTYWCYVCKYQGYFNKKKYDLKYHTADNEED